jgi:hypothetical protein
MTFSTCFDLNKSSSGYGKFNEISGFLLYLRDSVGDVCALDYVACLVGVFLGLCVILVFCD